MAAKQSHQYTPPQLLPASFPRKGASCSAFWESVTMVLAEIELMFFAEACMMHCFAFLMKVVVITHQCFSCHRAALTQSQGHPAPSAALPGEGTEPGRLTQNSQRGALHQTASCWGKGGGKGDIHSKGVGLPNKPLCVMGPAFLEMTEHLPAHGRVNEPPVLLCSHAWLLLYLGNCLYLNP